MTYQRSDYGYGGGGGGYGYGYPPEAPAMREPGARRRKLAAMAGTVYRAGVAAASEIKEQYNNTRVRGVADMEDSRATIPDSFPDVSIATGGDEQMVLFPSYAKRHSKEGAPHSRPESLAGYGQTGSMNDEEYWHHEFSKMEDKNAVVDVDVRGWIYSPQRGPMTRRNRVLVGLARKLSGIPSPTAPGQPAAAAAAPSSLHEEHEWAREEQRIAREAREIERRGWGEKEVASRGGYSEGPGEDGGGPDFDTRSARAPGRRSARSASPASSTAAASTWTSSSPSQPAELTEAELAVANANLMARVGPFMTTPLVQHPVTLFFYNDEQSQSRAVLTDDSGHFAVRAALGFAPTHVKVLANENLTATRPVRVVEEAGVSLISDIDDTIKRSSIAQGAREIFRNTFIRELGDLRVDGVREWYGSLHARGVEFHYCSNSPWQLFPVLATFFRAAGLPPGSIHLKQYSGMLQGIFEPVAERKKGSVERILRDFPERRFLLVGDSGEADLEVYTDLVVSNPGRILAVFIRDVTTPERPGYFDASFGGSRNGGDGEASRDLGRIQETKSQDALSGRPTLPPRIISAPPKPTGPAMGTLIDLSDEPESTASAAGPAGNAASSNTNPATSTRQAPPRPAKPAALRSSSLQVRPEPERAPGPNTNSAHSKPQQQFPPPPPPPRRGGAPSSPRLRPQPQQRSFPDSLSRVGSSSALNGDADADASTPSGTNKKLDLWRRRLAQAQEVLDQRGVALYTWRRGFDVVAEAEGIVAEALKKLGR